MSEMEGNNVALSGERIMESVGSYEEEVKLNTPVPAPHIIPFLFFISSLLSTGIKSVFLGGQGKCVRGRGENGVGDKSCHVRNGGKHRSFIWRGSYGVSWKS